LLVQFVYIKIGERKMQISYNNLLEVL